ncbi:hypothetical protein [Mycobacterium riyadhense]|uniref:hypothetical protein n=1 Tax=Mycobacterium riyadhense TaxID=486698 RepID=UPI00195A2DA0|nr:hypothetical protein [Mycobacterium riyadhense]
MAPRRQPRCRRRPLCHQSTGRTTAPQLPCGYTLAFPHDWYLGYDPQNRSLTATQQLIIADIVERIAAAAAVFNDHSPPSDRRSPSKGRRRSHLGGSRAPRRRYQVRGDYLHTYDPDDLEFLDERSANDLTALLYDLLGVDAVPSSA